MKHKTLIPTLSQREREAVNSLSHREREGPAKREGEGESEGTMSVARARTLRKSMTEAERRLWSMLRDRQLGWKFRRQYPLGHYVLDFACFEAKLAIEVDGGQHADSRGDDQRTVWLNAQGWRVLRFWNNEVMENTEGVVARILEALGR